MNSLAKRFAALTIALLAALSAGCAKQTDETPRAQAPVKAPQPIRFSYQDRIADAASIIAVERGVFDEHGLAVDAQRFSSGPACAETLYAGAADIATMGDSTAVIAAASDAPLTIIAAHGGGEHRHRIIVSGDSPLRNAEDLKGKRVAVKKGTATYGGLLAFLAAHGMSAADVDLIDMRPPEMPEALAAGSLDAIVASEPTPSLCETRGCRELATLGGLGNNYPILLVARTTLIEARPADVQAFIDAMTEAAEWVDAQPDEAGAIFAALTGLEPDVVSQAMRRHFYAVGLDEVTMSSLEATAQSLAEAGTIEAAPDLSAATCRDFVDAH